MIHDIQLLVVQDVNNKQDFSGRNMHSHYDFLGITCDFLGINRQLIPVSCEYFNRELQIGLRVRVRVGSNYT